MKTFKELTKNDFQTLGELWIFIEKREADPSLPPPEWAELVSPDDRHSPFDLVDCILQFEFGFLSPSQAFMLANRMHHTFWKKNRYSSFESFSAAQSRLR